MKKLIGLLLFVPLVYSCSKEKSCNPGAQHASVTVVVSADDETQVTVPTVITENFQGMYKTTFTATQHLISVQLHSDTPCKKTISIYVNGKIAAQRTGTCGVTDYDLTYDLNDL